jgi:tetratricopeptide (TPR) repeat protein
MAGSILHFPGKVPGLSPEEGRVAAEAVLKISHAERIQRSAELHLDDPEQLLAVCNLLRYLAEVEPANALDEASFFFKYLESPVRSIGVFDERDYYLGELALVAGAACRVLSRRDDARHWFDLAETTFAMSHNPSAHFARLAYQRMALRLEEREFSYVLNLAPRWADCFRRLDLREDAIKCGFLTAAVLKETEQLEAAMQEYRRIREEAQSAGLDRLVAMASQNLFQIHVFLGQVNEAIAEAENAASTLRRLNNRVNLAKLQLGVGYLLRNQQRLQDSINAFREAQRQFSEIKMHADVASTHLVLADILLDANQPAQAEWEIRAALPVIDELKLVPEGIAALSLLRDSVRRRQIDRQALRSLNGYFEELGS